jgi:arylsulfatase A-like enzyme
MPTQPNILIFMTDHQRADTVLPEHPAITPNLDRLVADSLVFTNAYCPSPHCCPSRATFFTGLYPSRHGVWNNVCNDRALSRGLKPGVRCWSEDLVDAGYQIHFSGKWHVSVEESPADRGWVEHFVSAGRSAYHGTKWETYRELARAATAQGMQVGGPRHEGEILRPGYGTYTLYSDLAGAPPDGHDETSVQKAIDVLPALARSTAPWCLYIGLTGPHDPYNVPRQFVDLYDLDKVPLPPSYSDTMADKPRLYQRLRNQIFGQLDEREVRDAIRHFWAFCSYLDSLFGRVMQALEATGEADNTVVLYTSDHGDYCGEHGLFAKGIPCFRGAYNTPAVIRWPRGVHNPGRRSDAFVSTADFGPTFLELAGVRGEQRSTGASLAPFLGSQPPQEWRDEMHSQCNGVELYYTQRSVMTRDYKYTFNGFDLDELYDLRRDPWEMVNLAADPAFEPAKRDLCRRLWRFAHREDDVMINQYVTVALAPYGPMLAFE